MPTATKDPIFTSDVVKNYDGPKVPLTKEQINTIDFQLKSKIPALFIDQDGNRFEVDPEKFKVFSAGSSNQNQATNSSTPLSDFDSEKQIKHLRTEGMNEDQIAQIMKPGTASVGSVTKGVDTSPVITVTPRSHLPSKEEVAAQPKEESLALKSAIQHAEERAAKNPPDLRHDLRGWLSWKSDVFVFNPLRRAFGRPERTLESHSYSGGQVAARSVPENGIGVSSTGTIGPTASSSHLEHATSSTPPTPGRAENVAFSQQGPSQSSAGETSEERGPASASSGAEMAGGVGAGVSSGLKNVGNALGAEAAHLKPAISGGVESLKKGLGGEIAGLKSSATGGLTGNASSLPGAAGKVAGAVQTAQQIGRAAAGDVTAMAQLGVKALGKIWENKEKIIGAALGVVAAPFLALYAALAPLLAAWGGLAAGVSAALGSIAGLGGAVGGALGGLGAALAAPAFGIGAITLGVGIFGFIPGGPKDQAEHFIVFGSQKQEQNIIVEKTATPSLVKNNTAAEIEYTIKLTNTTDHDWDLLIKDTDIKVYKNGIGTPLVMPDPIAPLPAKLLKTNNAQNPVTITFKKLPIIAGQYNDSQIKNVVEVTGTDPTSKETATFTAEATVVISDQLISTPYGYPFGGPITSMDDQLICVRPGRLTPTDYDRANCGVDDDGIQLVYKPHCGEVNHSGDGGSTSCLAGGLDIAGTGTVLSTATGLVTYSHFDTRLGGVVYIDSVDPKLGSYRAAFLHLNQEDLHPLGPITRGDKVGSIYNKSTQLTYETGFHLHYQVTKNGANVFFADYNQGKNPAPVIGPCLDTAGRTSNVRPTSPLLDKPGDVSYSIAPRIPQNVTCVK
jgi:hypothetical protein